MAATSNTTATFNHAENRIVGMMVGSAVADAIGIFTHNLTKSDVVEAYGRLRPVASYKANETTAHVADDHRAQYEDGSYSEVTEMALCSLLTHLADADPKQLPRRLRQLSLDGNRATVRPATDLGQPTKDIVESANYVPSDPTATPEQVDAAATAVALQRWISQSRGVRDRNGSNAPLVRIHPVAAVALRQNQNWNLLTAVENCRFTHVDAICNLSVMIAVTLLRGLLVGGLRTQLQINPLIQKCFRHIDFWGQAYQSKAANNGGDTRGAYWTVPEKEKLSRLLTAKSLADLKLDNVEDRGDVRKCLGAGIYCLRSAMTRLAGIPDGEPRTNLRKALFQELIHAVVREGGAAQANAAFAGALLGAYLGYDVIPLEYRKGLSDKNFLMRKSKLLCTYLRVITDRHITERDSRLWPTRNASERRSTQAYIQNHRRLRKQMLEKRRADTDRNTERRKTTYESLKFPARPAV